MAANDKNLHKNHRERMRKRFAKHGISAFNEHELVEYMLYYAIPRCDTNKIAHLLENEFGPIEKIVYAPREQLVRIKGIGENAALFFEYMSQMTSLLRSRIFENRMAGSACPDDIKEYFISLFIGEKKECVYAAGFDNNMKFVCGSKIAEGDLGEVESPVRKLYDFSVSSGCSRIIIAHNHPGSSCLPSPTDICNTTDLVMRLRWLEVAIEDHIIIGEGGAFSLRGSMHTKDIWGDKAAVKSE